MPAPATALAGPAMAAATDLVDDPPEKTLVPMAMKEPHATQNMRPGGLFASQLQQLTTSEGTTGRAWTGLEAGGRDAVGTGSPVGGAGAAAGGMGAPAAGR